jgi:hypothetical protein
MNRGQKFQEESTQDVKLRIVLVQSMICQAMAVLGSERLQGRLTP